MGLYSLKQVWQHSGAQQEVMRQVRQDPRLGHEVFRSQLPLSARELLPALQASVHALVDSFEVRNHSMGLLGPLESEGGCKGGGGREVCCLG